MKIVNRASGILLHITSLPSDFGIGDLGPTSYHFVDLLSQANQHYWGILPLTPTSIQYGNSPYQPTSAFAGNTLLISPELLVEEGLLSKENAKVLRIPFGQVDFKSVTAKKRSMLKKAYQIFVQKGRNTKTLHNDDFDKFCLENQNWLDEYALFRAIRDLTDNPWVNWPTAIRDRESQALIQKGIELSVQIEQEKFSQFVFSIQWNLLRNYCHNNGVRIIGDLPFYVGFDSSDVWANPEMFKLNVLKEPRYVGGVPPDYFSKTGQRWGNPVYNWQFMKKTNFQWLMCRLHKNMQMCDLLRLDHFRGYIAFWQIPACSKTARTGKWIRVPSKSLFKKLKSCFPTMPIIAEDLGMITESVRNYMNCLELPGMRVLLFAFNGSSDNPNLPSNLTKNSVVYSGTHDTNTVKGWFLDQATQREKEQLLKILGKILSKDQISLEFIRLAMASKSILSIIPLQDVLNLGAEARMNNPAGQFNNWSWRVKKEQLTIKSFENIAKITEKAGRSLN